MSYWSDSNGWCYHDDEPHPYEPEPEPLTCYECGAPEEELSIYNSIDHRAWCGPEHREATRRSETKRIEQLERISKEGKR